MNQDEALNGQIAVELFGWTQGPDGSWTDPTGDVFATPPNYTDNSGLTVGIEYKLHNRGWSLETVWAPGHQFHYIIRKGLNRAEGIADTKARAICLAVQQAFTLGLIKK